MTLNDLATVTIRFSAGYGTAGSNVPEGIRNWMLINVANLWENRETEVMASGRLTQIDMSSLSDGLLEDYRVYRW
ncbi:MAG: head-tail connector protein [Candidatus Nanopelagicales bacterium]